MQSFLAGIEVRALNYAHWKRDDPHSSAHIVLYPQAGTSLQNNITAVMVPPHYCFLRDNMSHRQEKLPKRKRKSCCCLVVVCNIRPHTYGAWHESIRSYNVDATPANNHLLCAKGVFSNPIRCRQAIGVCLKRFSFRRSSGGSYVRHVSLLSNLPWLVSES